jgi:hypothetical protein
VQTSIRNMRSSRPSSRALQRKPLPTSRPLFFSAQLPAARY